MHLTQALISTVIRDDMKNTTRRNWWVVWFSGCGDGVVHSVYDFCEDWDIGSTFKDIHIISPQITPFIFSLPNTS